MTSSLIGDSDFQHPKSPRSWVLLGKAVLILVITCQTRKRGKRWYLNASAWCYIHDILLVVANACFPVPPRTVVGKFHAWACLRAFSRFKVVWGCLLRVGPYAPRAIVVEKTMILVKST